MTAAAVFDAATEVAFRRERAVSAEARLAAAEVRSAAAEARIVELSEQVAVLSRMLFGRSSEKKTPVPGAGGTAGVDDGRPDAAGPAPGRGKRGQRPGGPGHGRRDYSGPETHEQVHDVPGEQRTCVDRGEHFEFLGSGTTEQIDWKVVITRIVHRRLRYRRRCDCPGPRTVIAPRVAAPVAKGRGT